MSNSIALKVAPNSESSFFTSTQKGQYDLLQNQNGTNFINPKKIKIKTPSNDLSYQPKIDDGEVIVENMRPENNDGVG